MKSLLPAVIVASALVMPAASFAQQVNGPLTRADVRAGIVNAQKAGLLQQNDTQYPKAVPAGSAMVTASGQGSQDLGGVKATSSDAGAQATVQQRIFSTYRSN